MFRCTLDNRFIDGDATLLCEVGCFGLEEFCSEVALLHFAFMTLALLTGVVSRVIGSWFGNGPTESSGACARGEGAGDTRARGGLLALVPVTVSRGHDRVVR